MSRELTLRCEDSLDGIFTAIYDAFVYKNQMERPYTDSIKIAIGEGNLTLFSTDLTVATDPIKVEKTVQTIQKRLGYSVYYVTTMRSVPVWCWGIWCVHLEADTVSRGICRTLM